MADQLPDEDGDARILEAIVAIIETWRQRDLAALSRINGTLAREDLSETNKTALAHRVLAQTLSRDEYANLMAAVNSLAPLTTTAVGETARRWKNPRHRTQAATNLLASVKRSQRSSEPLARTEAPAKVKTASQRDIPERATAQTKKQSAPDRKRTTASEVKGHPAAETATSQPSEKVTPRTDYRSAAEHVFERDFLSADSWFDEFGAGALSPDTFASWKANFVQRWVRRVLRDDKFDLQQAQAVASTSTDLRLVARAGSGKTRTIVTRALFLQLHCRVDAGSILLVAFNRKAVEEIATRIRAKLPQGARIPHVVTFHALACALLRPQEDLVFDDASGESRTQSRKVQAVVDDLIAERPADVRAAMLGFFTEDWKRIEQHGMRMTRDEYLARRSGTTRVTLGGEWVKSGGERLIANVLFEHDVKYKYERSFTRGKFNSRPDFTIMAKERPCVVIEYFGLLGDPKYAREAQGKRDFWAKQRDIAFYEFEPSDFRSLGEEGFRRRILETLELAGVKHRRLSEEEIWERVRDRAIDTFSEALTTFIGRSRQLNFDGTDIRHKASEIQWPETHVSAFHGLAADVYEEYLARARRDGYEDFSGVMWRAAAAVSAGATNWTRSGGTEHGQLSALQFVHVDEFQDFSAMFMKFIQAIRMQAPEAKLFCVGDDWQAINQFAGADRRFFTDFESMFPGATSLELATNYRSARKIVSAGNLVMQGLGTPALQFQPHEGQVQVARLPHFQPSPTERQVFHRDTGTPALLRLIRHALTMTSGTVAVLFRRNKVPWGPKTNQGPFSRMLEGYADYLRRYLPQSQAFRLDVTTSHQYKGREADYVIVADADAESYPLIHPTAELFEIFGDTLSAIHDADRRLFYVATTRAQVGLCYLVTGDDQSEFLESVLPEAQLVQWTSLPVGIFQASRYFEVRVYDAWEITSDLNRFGFSFDGASETWRILRPAEGFDFAATQRLLAFIGSRLIQVCDDSGQSVYTAGTRRRPTPRNPF